MNKKIGYYTCNGIEFESKIQALMFSKASNKPVQWWFNNDVFDHYPWHIEPELTLDQLYNARARQIREQYDYVILSYSGGADSNNVLESFLRQGLFIDEVVTNWALDASEKYTVLDVNERSAWNNNAEFKLHTTNRLNYIKSVSPGTKITVNDTSKALVESFLSAGDASWINKKREILNAGGTNVYNYAYFDDLRKQFDKGKRIAIVVGADKPKLKIINDTFNLFFVDKSVNMISIQDHIDEYPNAEPVYFYFDPQCADLICKQSHTVLKWIQANPHHKATWIKTDPHTLRHVQEELLKTIIYSTWNPSWFQIQKSVSDWDDEIDYWFSRGWAGTKEHTIWLEGLKHVQSKIGDLLAKNPDGSTRGLAAMYSQNYFIGNINV